MNPFRYARSHPPTQQLDATAPIALALEHFQSMNIPLGRSIVPRQGHPCTDGGIIFAQASGKRDELTSPHSCSHSCKETSASSRIRLSNPMLISP